MSIIRIPHAPKKPIVIVLLGPTASGKTDLSIQIAKKLRLGVHNFDSRQLYKGMDIGTAKPSLEQQQLVPHYLLNIREPNQPITLYEFQKLAQQSIDQTLQDRGLCLLVGGSGLYLKAITDGLQPPAVAPQSALRRQLQDLGQEICHPLLKSADPLAGQRIDSADAVRTQRALEVIYATGKSISSQQKKHPPKWQIIELGLDPSDLKERINKRTEQLFENGIIQETEQLLLKYESNLPMLQTIGYREALQVIEGQIELKEAIKITNRRTHQFAKRQRTWFRKQHAPKWLNDEEPLREALTLIETGIG